MKKLEKEITIRRAHKNDFEHIVHIDQSVIGNREREGFLFNAINNNQCYIALIEDNITGFIILDQSFFQQYYISLLIVHHEYRRMGIGKALMLFIEKQCPAEKLFTSTNQSNHKMQRLVESIGYSKSGNIDNLDDGDPEIIYFKRL